MRRNWLILAAAAATLLVLAYPVNNNIRYEVGVHRVSGYSIAETFSHRPLTFRFVSAAQSWLPTLASESLARGDANVVGALGEEFVQAS